MTLTRRRRVAARALELAGHGALVLAERVRHPRRHLQIVRDEQILRTVLAPGFRSGWPELLFTEPAPRTRKART